MRRVYALALAAVLCGCGGEPRFDATTDETARASMKRMAEGLPKERKAEFGRSLAAVVVPGALRRTFAAGGKGGPEPLSVTTKPLHGLTVAEINARAAGLRAAKAGAAAP